MGRLADTLRDAPPGRTPTSVSAIDRLLADTTVDDIDEALRHARHAIRTATTVPHRQACERYLDELLDQRAGTTR